MAYNGYVYPGGPPQEQESEAPFFPENGRCYGTYRKGQYMLPVDEDELDRLDIFHKFFQIARQRDTLEGGLHQRPLPRNVPLRILDLGCGTGIWTIDMADRYYQHNPQSRFIGLDLNWTQPKKIPQTIDFCRQDITEPNWGLDTESFDLIHLRMLAGSISDWLSLYRNIHRHLKVGGVIEHVEIDFRPLSDGSLPADSRLRHWANELCGAFEQAGKPLVINPDPEFLLKQAGFADVRHEMKEIPYHPWKQSEQDKELGRWFNLGMTQALEALTLAPLTRINRRSKEEVLALTKQVKDEICTRSLRSWCIMHVWHAKKEQQPVRNY
ncbi:S-adenosyl-L-methionine-dependent methyltransferase [Xylariales sp. AK1849]|nr:S-adenosyl-L-methionine-dependent methyltransferase [Xylariales sp. AK1849]